MILTSHPGPIGVFDSGYGGLTILNEFRQRMPELDFVYMGDNARAPYGPRSYEVVYAYTLQAVSKLFEMGCQLVILACNTASAKALRTIQQRDLPNIDANRRVLGVIRPTVEVINDYTTTKHVGIFGTVGTIQSESYQMEIAKFYPDISVVGEACPMWVALVENGEANSTGADYFVQKHIDAILQRDAEIDTFLLGCTHYPLLFEKIRKYTPPSVQIVSQGAIVAQSLHKYLSRHPEMAARCTTNGTCSYFTTENPDKFNEAAGNFLNHPVQALHLKV